MENHIVVKDYTAMDRILKEERKHIAGLVKKLVASGANVLLI
jgi:T-complex protein 1 subunit delta